MTVEQFKNHIIYRENSFSCSNIICRNCLFHKDGYKCTWLFEKYDLQKFNDTILPDNLIVTLELLEPFKFKS